MTGVVVLLVALAAAVVLGVVYRSRNGRMRVLDVPDGPRDPLAEVLAALVPEPGEKATLLQFSSAFCAPCRATNRILTGVAELVPGVTHVEIDAESHLDAVRALDILRTPTVLVLDSERRIARRASGQPKRDEVLSTIASLLPESSR